MSTSTDTVAEALANPILNSPYEEPSRYLEVGRQGPTGVILAGRRPSISYIPLVAPKKGGGVQISIDFDATGERIVDNPLINSLRPVIQRWRLRNYPGVTPVTRKLLQYWVSEDRQSPVLFCQREAAETAIFLAEVSGRKGETNFNVQLEEINSQYNSDLPRIALKMATGSGKTVVMAMLIAWQTINKVRAPHDNRFAKKFLVVTPGITIRDRLRVLRPTDDGNYFKERDLVPSDLWEDLLQAQVSITNYHSFMPKVTKEGQGISKQTKSVLLGNKKVGAVDPFVETESQVVTRVLADFGASKDPIVVFNDEAHHCYVSKIIDEKLDKEDEVRNEDARVWFKGLRWIRKFRGIKNVYDLSATPFFLNGSGYQEGFIFPWAVSDFALIEAIECGIVKIPRLPIDDDAKADQVVYLNLWSSIGAQLPKRGGKNTDLATWSPPAELEGALKSLYRSYEAAFEHYEKNLKQFGEPPPVMIVVCPNTLVSRLVFEWIAGRPVEVDEGVSHFRPGGLKLLSNCDENNMTLSRPHSILIDSAQLESGEVLSRDFKEAAELEIARFREEYRIRKPGADVDLLTDSDLLREVMNTVGKRGQLGEHIRCVVSVSMLTEGWDANNVSHILGIRAFNSQLLCEQVVGRGLRRRSYEVNEHGHFDPEYAEVYGVPFQFIPSDKDVPNPKPKSPSSEVYAMDERSDLCINFPKVDGYRVEMPEQELFWEFSDDTKFHLDNQKVANWVESKGPLGVPGVVEMQFDEVRPLTVAFELAKMMLNKQLAGLDGDRKPWLFPQLVRMCKEWLESELTVTPGTNMGHLMIAEFRHEAAERAFNAIVRQLDNDEQVLLPILRRFDPVGSTNDVQFLTRKRLINTIKSHVNKVVLDGIKGNTWEEAMAETLEKNKDVAAYVKNDHLDFWIPYVHQGKTLAYVPDFLVRLNQRVGDVVRTLIVEVSGTLKSAGPTEAKANTARLQWCRSVNNAGNYGRWGYIEVGKPEEDGYDEKIANAIAALYGDDAITGMLD